MRDIDQQNLRERIEGLQMHEQLAVVLEAYDALRANLRDDLGQVCGTTDLSPKSALLFLTLYQARGRVVTLDQISEREREVFGDYASKGSHISAMKRLRRRVEAMGLPVTFKAHWRVGYAMIAPKGWTPPWETDNE